MDETMTNTETLTAYGHENVSGRHGSTFEVTSDDYLTPAGDCILAIEADRVPSEFDLSFVQACQQEGASITLTLKTENYTEQVEASGHPELTFESDRSMVIRTSEYVDDRTVAVEAEKAASDLSRGLVSALAEGKQLTVTLQVEAPAE